MSKKFQSKNRLRRNDGEQIEGRNAVLEAFNASREIKRLFINKDSAQEGKLLEIIKKARGRGVEIQLTAKGNLDFISSTSGMHQGIIAIAAPRVSITLKRFLEERAASREQIFVIMVTDNQDERNLGGIMRTAAAVGAGAVIVPTRMGHSLSPVVLRASAGAAEYIHLINESTFSALKMLSDYGVKTVAIELSGKSSIYDLDLTGDVAFIIGGEDKGVSDTLISKVDESAYIPMVGKAQSLNMSVSSAIVIYEKLRQEFQSRKQRKNK